MKNIFKQKAVDRKAAQAPLSVVRPIDNIDSSELADFIKKYLDPEVYLTLYPDVKVAGVDPVEHWLEHGYLEGRRFSPSYDVLVDIDTDKCAESIHRFEWNGKQISIISNVSIKITPDAHVIASGDESAFRGFVNQHLDPEEYLTTYPDVKAAGCDPVHHWLEWGIFEGRRIGSRVAYVTGEAAERVRPGWRQFNWKGRAIALRVKATSARVLKQIEEQSDFDLNIVSAGVQAIANLPEFDSTDLLARDNVDVAGIFSSVRIRPYAVFLTPFLCTGGAEKYCADIVQAMHTAGTGPILVVVTDQRKKQADGWEALEILAPFKNQEILFWQDACGPAYDNATALARFLNALRPAKIIVNNSRIGLDAVAKFGNGLSQYSQIYCTFFSLGLRGLGAPHGARFPHRTLPFSTALTDNFHMADELRRIWGGISGPGVIELPAKLETVSENLFQSRLAARRKLAFPSNQRRKWVWVSRIEPFKGTDILNELAMMRPNDTFDVFGPLDGTLEESGLIASNIAYKGLLESVAKANFQEYTAFIFTSLFEGMPNILLEMSQHAIPIVSADVGGIRGCFNDEGIIFVAHGAHTQFTAASFSVSLDKLSVMSDFQIEKLVTAARLQAVSRHSADAYFKNFNNIFGQH